MKQLFIKRGDAVVEEVPAPVLEHGSVLVRVTHSCISSGTELSGVRNTGQPLWKRALKHPEEVRKVVDMATAQGVAKTLSVVQGRLSEGLAVGYSAAGTVVEVGPGVDDLHVGERVACAGTGVASHAEVIRVPRNLLCKVPDGLDLGVASTVALGAIALQSVRRAQPTLGETFVVIGLGALGQLAVQLLRANGCRVIGSDVNPERVTLARNLGMDSGFQPDGGNDVESVLRLTKDVGADGVIITASSPSDVVVSGAFRMCRRRGRVILVGDVGLALQRQDIYEKELDFLVSTSYGPGRYDAEYETKGLSYPVAYVRWTETRNMQAYLDLAASSRIQVAPLIGGEFPLNGASNAYEALNRKEHAPILAVLTYGQSEPRGVATPVANPRVRATPEGFIRLAVVGPGSFVRAVHLPNIASMPDLYRLHAVVSRSAPRALSISRQFGGYASTAFDAVLNDQGVDAVLIATRHDQHASMVLQALRAGKHVLVEKPLALNETEVNEIRAFFEQESTSPKPILLTGFNRRFSPYAQRIRAVVAQRSFPMVITYRMNAGYIPADHWVHGEEGGGRNVGEACHIYDLFTYLTESPVAALAVQAIPPPSGRLGRTDNFIVNLRYENGSIAALTYTSLGHRDYPKEHLEIFVDGKVISMDDYRQLKVIGSNVALKSRVAEKGHAEELREFARAIKTRSWPIPLWQQLQATEIALRVQAAFCGASDFSANA